MRFYSDLVTAEYTTPTPRGLRALAHPVRLRILGMLRLEGPATASGLAERLGLNSGATSYHLRQLAEHGFVVDDPDRGNARERWWRAAHRTTRVPIDEGSDEPTRDAQNAFLQAAAVTYNRQIQRAVEDQSTLEGPWRRASDFSDWSLRLTPDEAHSLVRELHEVMGRYRWWRPDDEDAPADAGHFRVLLQAFPRPGALDPPDDL